MGLTIKACEAGSAKDVFGQGTTQNLRQEEKKNIYGGNLKLGNDSIAQRRAEAQKQAWNVVKNAWNNDNAVDEMIQKRRDHSVQMEAQKKDALEELADINDNKEVLRELYGVDKESEEQKAVELLEKEQNINKGVSDEELTEEEQQKLSELHQKPLTEYQSRRLALNNRAIEMKKQVEDADLRMQVDTANIHSIQQERLKSNPMLEAQKAAEEIQKAANEAITGMIMQDAKNQMDENMDDVSEKTKEAIEKKEERDAKLEKIKLERAVQQVMIAGTEEAIQKAKNVARANEVPDIDISDMMDIACGDSVKKDVGDSLSEIKSNMKVLEADLKGIKVDEEV